MIVLVVLLLSELAPEEPVVSLRKAVKASLDLNAIEMIA